jgi:hypothetical protein
MNPDNPAPDFQRGVFGQTFIIARALGNLFISEEYLLLAILKTAPDSLAVQYLETIQSKESWKKQWQSRLLSKSKETSISDLDKLRIENLLKVLQTVHKERELLKCKSIDENCALLAILRYQDFDGLVYKDAIQFMKKHISQ